MKQIDNYIQEKLYISKNYCFGKVHVDIIYKILSSISDDKDLLKEFDEWNKDNIKYFNITSDFDSTVNKKWVNIPEEYDKYINFDKELSKKLDDEWPYSTLEQKKLINQNFENMFIYTEKYMFELYFITPQFTLYIYNEENI